MGAWRIYQDEPTPGIVEIGLERMREERSLLRPRAVVEERLLGRHFGFRDRLGIGRYHAILTQAVEHLARGTFGAYVDIDTMTDGVRVRLVCRTIGPQRLEVTISGERHFTTEQVSDAAGYAEELRSTAREENEALWEAAREETERAAAALADAQERARDAAELSQILQSQEDSA